VVFPSEPGPSALRLQKEGAVVHALGLPEARVRGSLGAASATLGVHRLARVLSEFEPDVAHGLDASSSALVALAGRVSGVPVLAGTLRHHASRRPSWAARGALRRLDHLVAPTEAMREAARGWLGRACPPVTVIPQSVDAAEVTGFARAPEFSEPRPRVAVIAPLVRGRGMEEVLAAAPTVRRDLPDLEWLVSGAGPDGMAFLRAAQNGGLADTVRLLGEREDLGRLLASVDACVSPDALDAAPPGLLHGLVAGLPCVAAENPSVAATVGGGEDAVLVPPRDAPALAAAVARLLAPDSAGLRARLANRGAAVAQRCSVASVSSAVQALYATLIGDARRRK
jgi:glycosyltransferase involved in cell wall biosynthesis